METIVQDLRYAARSLVKQPGFTLIVVLTLAVGIGANTAIYTVLDATILRALPFKEPDRLMRVSLIVPLRPNDPPNFARNDLVWSYPKYETFVQNQNVFESTALYRGNTFNLTGTDQPERLFAEIVGANYFPLLGIQAEFGRVFLPEEDAVPQRDFVAVLSHSLWERRFGADPGLVGKTISLDQRNYTVVGILPPGFQGLSGPADVWVPVHIMPAQNLSQRQSHSWQHVARLKPGVSVDQAKSAVTALGAVIDRAHPDPFGADAWSAGARSFDEARLDPEIRKSVLILFGAVSLVLLIACVNVANLLLARGSARQREIAIRCAVGAGRIRLIRQLLTESLLLAMVGAAASLTLAYVGVIALGAINPTGNTLTLGRRLSGLTLLGLNSIHLDSSALLFTFAAAIVTGLLFGLAPAWQCSRTDLTDSLKRGKTRPKGIRFLGGKSVLVVVEVALALVLLIGAGLTIKSFGRLIATRTGVNSDNVLTARINLPPSPTAATAALQFFIQLEQRVAALPGVISAGMGNCHVLAGGCNATGLWYAERPAVPRGTEPVVGVHFVSPAYFKTMMIPLVRGRLFTEADRRESPRVVVISDMAARRLWPNDDPLGKSITLGQGQDFNKGAEVIGIVGNVRYGQMEQPPQPDVYISQLQSPMTGLLLFARTTGDPNALIQAVRHEVQALNRDLPIYDVKTLDERISNATARSRFSAILLLVFAGVALILAAVGIYGVMSYVVRQRTQEIGIRMALGARSQDVLWVVTRRALLLILLGIGLGIAGALAATRVLVTLLYEVKPDDLSTYILISILLAGVALVAGYIPARRASVIDPCLTLRAE